ncbi:hypothetical protein [Nocardioides daphniae]|uniref:Uncharacterized protein n=1 Tax=Nocardioides daphniae TaxID=402297 RepID=A0ABQ1QI48_9ACTN|nr:hypothetical protein [Nocardioides daphniae]GGD27079.1 hypothetical protein GCM10007231_28140 [Nocardioides daphniae]
MSVGRPSLPVGTWGDFTFTQPRKTAWRARTRIRDLDGGAGGHGHGHHPRSGGPGAARQAG